LPEPLGGAHSDPLAAATILKQALVQNLDELTQMTSQQRRQMRYQKFRKLGVFTEST
jgi:acetyl-CoA carboxylase carboxyl transferase subunit alpha